jgi:hypothetical protein
LSQLVVDTTKIKDQGSLYIPALIPEANQELVAAAIKGIQGSLKALGFHYSFQKSEKVSQLYNGLLSRLAQEESLMFDTSFAAKIENRSLGMVAGTYGSVKWTTEGKRINLNFAIAELDCNNLCEDSRFARHKVLYAYIFKICLQSTFPF